jgi:hypothetical protein
MREMTEFTYMDGIKKLKYFTRMSDQTWFVQRDKNSICESFFVTLIPDGLCMSGDYDGLIVRPFTRSNWETIGWMAGATTLSYFAEKVMLGNQHHQAKEYDQDYAINQLVDDIVSRYEIEDMKDMIKEAFYTRPKLDIIGLRAKEINEDFSEKYIKEIQDIAQDCYDAYLEFEHNFYEFGQELESKYNLSDMWELDYRRYTRQLRWQQSCLIWWARNILYLRDGKNPNNIEYVERKDERTKPIESIPATQ